MGLLADLGDRIEANVPSVIVGTNLHLGVLLAGSEDAGSLVEYDGAGIVRRHDETATTLVERPRVQLMWRSRDYETGLGVIRAAWKALECTNLTIGTTWYQRIEADTAPFAMGRDDNDRWLFACNFTVTREAA
jgi:hypothetical protein